MTTHTTAKAEVNEARWAAERMSAHATATWMALPANATAPSDQLTRVERSPMAARSTMTTVTTAGRTRGPARAGVIAGRRGDCIGESTVSSQGGSRHG